MFKDFKRQDFNRFLKKCVTSDNNEDIGILTPPLIGRNLTEMTSYRAVVQSQNTAHKEFPNSLSIREICSKTGYSVEIN